MDAEPVEEDRENAGDQLLLSTLGFGAGSGRSREEPAPGERPPESDSSAGGGVGVSGSVDMAWDSYYPQARVGKHRLIMKPRIIVACTTLPDGRRLELHEHDGAPYLHLHGEQVIGGLTAAAEEELAQHRLRPVPAGAPAAGAGARPRPRPRAARRPRRAAPTAGRLLRRRAAGGSRRLAPRGTGRPRSGRLRRRATELAQRGPGGRAACAARPAARDPAAPRRGAGGP